MKKTIILSVFILGLTLASPISAAERPVPSPEDSIPELHVEKSGKLVIKGAKVMQVANTTIFTRLAWDRTNLTIVVKTEKNTKILRRFGGPAAVSDIAVGDYLNLEGTLEFGSDSLVAKATKITDLSIQTEDDIAFRGTIAEVNVAGEKFKLQTPNGTITVEMKPDIVINKGNLKVNRFDLMSREVVSGVSGVFDKATNTLKADRMTMFVDMSLFAPRNFQGAIKSVAGATAPTSLVVSIDDEEYTVKIDEKTEILTNKRKPAQLKRFVAGDKVRLYGHIVEENQSTIDGVEIIRNLDL